MPRKMRCEGEENRRRVLRLARKNLTAIEIATVTGLSDRTVQNHLRNAGVKRKTPLADKRKVLRLVAKHGAKEAARLLKVSRAAIYLRIAQWATDSQREPAQPQARG